MTTAKSVRSLSSVLAALTAATALLAAGCTTTPRQFWDSLKGDGFPEWSDKLGSNVRSGPAQAGKPSGFFTDRRSEQIERDLGGF
jgi:hypothetical protein